MDRGMECIKIAKTEDCEIVVVVKNQRRGNKSSGGYRGSRRSRGRRVEVREPQLNRVQ